MVGRFTPFPSAPLSTLSPAAIPPTLPASSCFCSSQQNALTAAQSAEQSEALMESREMILMLQTELHGVTSERDDFRDHLERLEIDRQGLLQQLEVQHDNTSEA